MDILLETTWGEYKQARRSYWNELDHNLGWMGFAFIMIVAQVVASFYLESSISFPKPGEAKIVFGGPVSWIGFFGAAALASVYVWTRRRHARATSQWIQDDEVIFLRFTDAGMEFGTRGAGAASYSWQVITRVDITPQSIVLELPSSDLVVNGGRLKPEELAAIKAFFAAEREYIRPENSISWRRGDVGKESFGAVKRYAVK